MTQDAKLYAKLLASQKIGISFRDFERLLTAFGFVLVRQRGSHRIYVSARCDRPLIVQPRGSEAKPYQVPEFLDMIEEHRLAMDDR